MEGNYSFTHTEKFKKRQNPSRARESHIAIIPIDVHHISICYTFLFPPQNSCYALRMQD